METEHDQFEQVRKLLALKKYEQPPPRYFQEFSSGVLAQLQIVRQRVTWRQRLGLDFDFNPAIVGAVGVGVCVLLLVGVITSLGGPQSSTTTPGLSFASDSPAVFSSPNGSPSLVSGFSLAPIPNPEEIPASTVPVSDITPGSSPFNQLLPRTEPARFKFTPGN